MTARLRIGTRGSPLALAQTEEVCARLAGVDPALAEAGVIEVVVIRTTGDRELDRPLAEIGGKGLFTKEIDEALLAGRIDLAVNSMKDLPTLLPGGIALGCVLERDDPRDVFVGHGARRLAELPPKATVGTASLRRRAQVLDLRPDLAVVPLRGNVGTRIEKVRRGEVDATLLALAGLRRLGLAGVAEAVVDVDEMLPAVAQGAIGVSCRKGDSSTRELLASLNHAPSWTRVAAERAFLEALDGSCRTPIAALAEMRGRVLDLRGLVARPDGSRVLRIRRQGAAAEAEALGREAGLELKARAGPGFLAAGA